MKRILSAFISSAILCAFSVTAYAEGFSDDMKWLYGVYQDGTAVISSGAPAVSKYSGNVVIPSEIDGYTVAEIGWYCFTGESGLFSVEIPETVAVVGNYAFENCYGLNTVCFDSSSASAGTEFIGEGAFINCYGLNQLNLPAGLKTIGDKAFSDCTALSTVNIPYGVEIIGAEAFGDCTALQVINIPVTVTELGDDIFDGCTSMLTVYYEGSDSQWKEISKDESDFEDINIIYAYSVGTDYDEPAELPDYEPYANYNGFTYKVNTDDTVVINGYTGDGKNIVIPSEIEGYIVARIGENAFEGCGFIEEISIPSTVTEIGEYAFANCNSLKRAEIPDGVTVISHSLFKNCGNMTEVVIPAGITLIQSHAFYNCVQLDNVYFCGGERQWEDVVIAMGNDYAETAEIIYNYDPVNYNPPSAVIAIILCAAAILVPVIVAIIVATRKKPVCPHCGAQLDNNSKFCGSCGKEL